MTNHYTLQKPTVTGQIDLNAILLIAKKEMIKVAAYGRMVNGRNPIAENSAWEVETGINVVRNCQ